MATRKKTKSRTKPVKKSVSRKVVRAAAKSATRAALKAMKKTKAVDKHKVIEKPKPVIAKPKSEALKPRPVLPKLKTEIVKPRPALPKPKTTLHPPRLRAVMHVAPMSLEERRSLRAGRNVAQFAYMKAPGADHAFEVGDTVEVFCDHEKNNNRVRGWIKGIVVQVDNKMVAVQFRSNVYLTDGWMVPDRILWYPVTSDQIRTATLGRRGSRKEIPDY